MAQRLSKATPHAVRKTELYDAAKVATTILVVVAHIARMYTPSGAISVAAESAFLSKLHDLIYAFHMPLFMFLSGCVYGYCIEIGKYRKNLQFVSSKAKKFLIPYLVFGLLYVGPAMCLLGIAGTGYWEYIWKGIILSYNSRHLWFILALFWVFILAMLLRPLLGKGIKGLILMVGISALLFVCTPFMPPWLQLQAVAQYQLFFFLGIIFNRYYKQLDQLAHKYRFLGVILPVMLMGVLVFNPNTITRYAYRFIGTLTAIYISWIALRLVPSITNTWLYRYIRKNSFGIYLFHPMIIYLLFYYFGSANIHPIIFSAIVFIVSTVLSAIMTDFFRKVHLRIIIGE